MAQYQVWGADHQTGDDVCILVDADDEAEARSKANEQGVLVSRIESAGEPSNLISCPDCGHQISKLAAACPACGRPSDRKRPDDGMSRFIKGTRGEMRWRMRLLAVALGSLVIAIVLALLDAAPGPGPVAGIFLLLGVLLGGIVFVHWFGGVPGAIARSRGHPDALAIAICGWVGVFTFFILWLVALIWAHTNPKGR